MKKATIVAAWLVFHAAAASQQIAITVNSLATERGVLSAVSGEKLSTLDSVAAGDRGRFTFALGQRNPAGVYRLAFDRGRGIDFVYDGEDVEIVSDARGLTDSLTVISSESNRLYHAFRKLNQTYRTKSEILQLVLARYPHDDPYYQATLATVADLQREYLSFVRSATATRPASFAARYIRAAQLPVVDLARPPEQQLALLKAHALDYVDFTDEGLVHSDLFTGKSIEYLTYFRNPRLPKELLAREFNSAVDSILNRAKVNALVYRHVTEYLIDGFKQFGFEECINYILDNYVVKDDLCLDEGSGSTIQRMIDQKKRLPVGVTAPEIVLPDTAGIPRSLLNMSADTILVVFYSTSCPHCQTMIPRLKEIAGSEGKRRLAVLAVSLDGRRNDWLNFIASNKLAWTNVNDPAGWGGRAASEYFIYATPTMVLLNAERKIIGKPLTIGELLECLSP